VDSGTAHPGRSMPALTDFPNRCVLPQNCLEPSLTISIFSKIISSLSPVSQRRLSHVSRHVCAPCQVSHLQHYLRKQGACAPVMCMRSLLPITFSSICMWPPSAITFALGSIPTGPQPRRIPSLFHCLPRLCEPGSQLPPLQPFPPMRPCSRVGDCRRCSLRHSSRRPSRHSS